jgi:hypothetical protein
VITGTTAYLKELGRPFERFLEEVMRRANRRYVSFRNNALAEMNRYRDGWKR